jgi:hypothetical protein
VRSAAVLSCGSLDSALFASAEGNVTVVAPIVVQNLSVGPDPIEAGGTAYLRGTVTGGEPPYTLRVVWGDRTTSAVGQAAGGTFAIPHAFPAGNYSPSLEVTDSGGLLAHGTVGEALAASGSLVVGINAESYVTDVGTPTRFSSMALHVPAGSDTGWSCGTLSPGAAPAQGLSTDFSCAFSATGTGQVFFEVLPPPPFTPASATLYESVVPVPTLAIETPNFTAEVGQPSLLALNVTGGVPPFSLDWAETGSAMAGQLRVATDGQVLLPLDPTEAGSLELVARDRKSVV